MTKEQLQVFDDIEELLENRYKIEDNWASTTNQFWERAKYLYGRCLCETLIFDLQTIKKRYMENEKTRSDQK